jgi:hypothetical protein
MRRFVLLAGFVAVFAPGLRADILNLSNGDRYVGAIELVNAREVHLKSEVVGLLKIPREKVASIYFGTNQPGTVAAIAIPKMDLPESKTKIDPEAVEKVQRDFLATATPEANAMFSDLVQGLASGKLSVDDLRAQARDSLKELRALQAEIGEEDDNPLLAGYVGILEKFINQGSTNRAKAVKPKIAPQPAAADGE